MHRFMDWILPIISSVMWLSVVIMVSRYLKRSTLSKLLVLTITVCVVLCVCAILFMHISSLTFSVPLLLLFFWSCWKYFLRLKLCPRSGQYYLPTLAVVWDLFLWVFRFVFQLLSQLSLRRYKKQRLCGVSLFQLLCNSKLLDKFLFTRTVDTPPSMHILITRISFFGIENSAIAFQTPGRGCVLFYGTVELVYCWSISSKNYNPLDLRPGCFLRMGLNC